MFGRREGPGRHAPWGLLGMLGLVMSIEWALAGHDLDFTAVWHWDWRIIGKAATRPERVKGREFLLFGDSLVKFGLMPRVIEEATGKPAYNFALHTGQTSSSYFMFRRTLEAGARPSAIVLDLTPHMFMQPPETNKNLWPELLGVGECLDLSRAMKSPDFFASTMLGKLLPSYKERFEIRASLMAALNGTSTSKREQITVFRRNWKVNDGAQLLSDGVAPTLNLAEWVGGLYAKWSPHPVNVAYLDRLLTLAASKGVRVYWLLPPIHPEVQLGSDANRFDAAYSDFVRSVHSRFPGVVVVDARHSGFTADLFADGVHVNRRGASKLSSAIADVLRHRDEPSGSTRWLALDASRVRETGAAIEDVNQSHLAWKAARDASTRR